MDIIGQFQNPPRAYSPVPFWFLNEKLEKDRLQWQVREMHDKHVFGAIMHARPGLVTPYLSEEWFSAIGSIIQQASALDMFMWIYDEYPWMSGMAEYRVPKLHPDFRIRALDCVEEVVEGPKHIEWNIANLLPQNSGAIIAVLKTPMFQDRLMGTGEDITSSLSNGQVVLDVPPGRYLLAVYFEHFSWNPYGDGFGKHEVTDLMHPDAIQAFINLTHREYEARFGGEIGKTVTAAFTDEPPSNTPGWSVVLLDEFRRRKGYDLREHLGMLWHDAGPATGKVRIDYGEVVSELYEENFFGALEQWADSVGVASTGHLLLEETIPFHVRFMGDYFRSMRRLHYPGIDYIFPGVIPAVVPKMASSVANLYGRDRVMSECFALTGWNFTFEHMKWMTDWQLVHGVNLLVPHAFFYSSNEKEPIPKIPDDLGFRWYDCPPSMFFQQPYWDYYGAYADYARRSCWLVSQGMHCNDEIGIYYPYESVQAEMTPTKEDTNVHAFEIPGTWMTADYIWEGSSAEQTDAHLRATANQLRDSGLDFDIIDDDSLRRAEVKDNCLIASHCRTYRCIILPRTRWISEEVYGRIEDFWRAGGVVMATGDLPRHATDGPEKDWVIHCITERIFGVSPLRADKLVGAGRPASQNTMTSFWFSRPSDDMAESLRRAGFGSFQSSSPDLYCMHRYVDGGDLFYLVHHSPDASGEVTVRLKGSGSVRWMDPLTGETRQAQHTASGEWVELHASFDPWEACFVFVDSQNPEKGMAVQERPQDLDLQQRLQIEGPWKVTLDGGDRSPERLYDLPEYPKLEELELEHSWDALAPWETLGLEEFSGAATYETTFNLEGTAPDAAWLDLGEVGLTARVWLNGTELGTVLWRPYRVAVGEALKEGQNTLRIRVANTVANAMQASYGTGRAHSEAGKHHRDRWAKFKEGELRSGLIGPVRILSGA